MPTLLAGQNDPHPLLLPDGDQMGTVLGDAGTVVDQDDLESGGLPAGTGLAQRAPSGLLENLTVPATVRCPSFLERAVGLLQVAGVGPGEQPIVAAPGHEPADGEHDHGDAEDRQDYGEG